MVMDLLNIKKSPSLSNRTNNGLNFEEFTSLEEYHQLIDEKKGKLKYRVIKLPNNNFEYIYVKQGHLTKYMGSIGQLNNIEIGHGCKNPDECYINLERKKIFILEKKYQSCHGSAAEKLQTAPFKLKQYRDRFPNFQVYYIYVLSNWFGQNCKAELEYLQFKSINVFWGEHPDYKRTIMSHIYNMTLNN